ncbi:MAG: hypothetical protein K5979_13145 [Ruminococcus sp.]|nr:hypothetical protein [Ruminococcus sp.]
MKYKLGLNAQREIVPNRPDVWRQNEQCLQNELPDARKENERLSDELKELAAKFEAYAKAESVFNNYRSLPPRIKNEFSRLICSDSVLTFIISGSSTDELELIWEAICCRLTEYDSETLSILKEAADLFFEYNMASFGKLERLKTKTGAPYNSRLHDRLPDSNIDGVIAEVVFEGYRNRISNKIIRSIVRL